MLTCFEVEDVEEATCFCVEGFFVTFRMVSQLESVCEFATRSFPPLNLRGDTDLMANSRRFNVLLCLKFSLY